MKLKVLQEDFLKALGKTSRFISNRAQLPVLGNILLKSKNNRLYLLATNLEMSISISIGAKVEKDGIITVPARVLLDIISNLYPGQLSLEAEEEHLKIESKNYRSRILGMNPNDFPKIPETIKKGGNLDLNDFSDCLSKILFSVSIDESRPTLTGVLFLSKKGSLTLVSTDGYRLSRKILKVNLSDDLGRFIVPKTVLAEILRVGSESDGIEVQFDEKENQIIFSCDSAIVSSRVIGGEFPDFEKIIPKESLIKIAIDREDLLQAVKLASVFARDSSNVIKINVNNDFIEIESESSQSGKQKTKVEASIETENTIKNFLIAFNYKFLEDFLQAAKGDEIKISFTDANSPGVFEDSKDSGFLHLIMPVRT